MSEKIYLNFEGTKFQVEKGKKYNTQNNEGIKKIMNIFDWNKNGILEENEFNDVNNFTAGIFGYDKGNNCLKYDENTKEEGRYASSWKYDNNNNLIERKKEKDHENNGQIDERVCIKYNEQGKILVEQNEYFNEHYYGGGSKEGQFVAHSIMLNEYTYDDSGENLITYKQTITNDGKTIYKVYGERGDKNITYIDEDGDGNWDQIDEDK